MVTKLRAWSDWDGDIERSFTKDRILTNITLHWLTGTIGTHREHRAGDRARPRRARYSRSCAHARRSPSLQRG